MQDLVQMLKDYEIKNIISVDDGWSTSDKLVETIIAQGLDESITVKGYCDIYAIDIEADERDDFDELGDIPLKNLETVKDKISKTFAAISDNLNVDIDASLKVLKCILNELQEREKFCVCFGEKFETSYKELEGNTLYIFDKDMGPNQNQETEFLDYIVKITEERKTYNDLIIVYSNEVAELLKHDKKVRYLEANYDKGKELEVLYQFWPLSKITDENQLVNGIKEMVSKSMYGKALSKMIEMKRISIDNAFKDLLHINIDNLDDMIIESYIEGGKITESYELLMDSLVRKRTLEQIMTSDILAYEKGLLQYEVNCSPSSRQLKK